MKASEIKLENTCHPFSCNNRKPGSHYKSSMLTGCVFPSTASQAKFFISQGVCLDLLNGYDVEIVESILNKYGFEGNYTYTKSKTWVRLQNNIDLQKALKLDFLGR